MFPMIRISCLALSTKKRFFGKYFHIKSFRECRMVIVTHIIILRFTVQICSYNPFNNLRVFQWIIGRDSNNLISLKLTGSFSESPQYIVFRATVTAIPFPSKNAAKISSLEKAVVTTTISWIKVLHCTLSTMWKIKG